MISVKGDNKSIINVILLFLYLVLFNFMLFHKDLDYRIITVFLVTFFTWCFLLGVYGLSKILYKIFLVLHIIIFIPYFVANEMFNGVSNNHITALYFTNFTESFSYLKVVPINYIIKALLIILPFLYFFNAKFPKFKKKYSWMFLGLVFLYTSFKLISNSSVLKDRLEYTYRSIYVSPFRIIIKTLGMYDIVKRDIDLQLELQKLPNNWNISSVSPQEDVYIVVLGESVRRDFLEIYNSKFNNSPFLKSIPKIQFNNVLSFAGTTMESLSRTLVMNNDKGNTYFPNNIVSLSQKANFEVDWISNQGSIGRQDNFIAAMAKNADYNQFTTKGIGATFKSDDKLLDIFKERINAPISKKKVVFLHLMGSHPAPCDITEGKYDEFIMSNDVSCYNETIKRTDKFLKQLHQITLESGKSYKIIYFADHGLTLNKSKILFHGSQYKQNYEVPLVVIDPKMKETIYINEYRNLKDFLFLFSELLQIKTTNLNPTYRFISEEKSKNVFMLDNHLNYKKLADNPITE